MNTPKRNHFVPRNYLKAWSNDGCRIFQLDKTAINPVPKLVGLRDAGVERFIYTTEMEQIFGREVEIPAWPVLAKLRGRMPVKRPELDPLFRYLVAQMARTPRMRDLLKAHSNEAAQAAINEFAAMGIDLPAHNFDVERISTRYEELIPLFQLHQPPLALQAIRNMTWTVNFLGPAGEFITNHWC